MARNRSFNFRSFSAPKRRAARAAQLRMKAESASRRSQERLMAFQRRRAVRIERYRHAYSRFIPLTVSRFGYLWAALAGLFSGLGRGARRGSQPSAVRAGRISGARPLALEGLEARAMLSAVPFTGSYQQNFDGLTTDTSPSFWINGTTLPGWSLFTQHNGGTAVNAIEAGGSIQSGFYSYGAVDAPERALGSIGHNANNYFGTVPVSADAGWMTVALQNNTGATINSVNLSYDGEQWLRAENLNAQTMELQYGFGADFGSVASWNTPGADFNFTSPTVGADEGTSIDGNAAANRSTRGGTLSGLDWNAGETMWVRWVEKNDPGFDHGLAIDNFSITADEPESEGPATFNVAVGESIQAAIDQAEAGDTIQLAAGTFVEDVLLNKAGLRLIGAGPGMTVISGAIGGAVGTITVAASNTEIAGLTITREGNNTTDWNLSTLNSTAIAIQGQAITGTVIHDNLITGNRTGIDVNNSNGHTIRNNRIVDNRTGLIFRNQTDDLVVTENEITDNWTVGIVFLDASSGSNVPVQTAANSVFTNNNISGNWYGQVVDRQTGGALPAAGTTNLKNFSGNWFGTTSPVITTANSAEPGYAGQIPVAFGGSATAPGGQPDIAGSASANFDISPMLTQGADTNVETTPGRGTYGFQGNFGSVTVTAQLAQTGTSGRINEGLSAANEGGVVNVAAGSYAEAVTVDKRIHLLGAGSGADPLSNTIIDGSSAGTNVYDAAITLTGAGSSESDRLVIQGIRIVGTQSSAINIGGDADDNASVSHLTIQNIVSIAAPGNTYTRGVHIHGSGTMNDLVLDQLTLSNHFNGAIAMGDADGSAPTVAGFTLTNSALTDNRIAFHNYAVPSSTANETRFTDVTIADNEIVGNSWKGLYFEILDNAVIERNLIQNTGFNTTYGGGNGNTGVELNLKYGNHANVQILNNTFDNSGAYTGSGTYVGGALAIKPRNDASGYHTNPATLDNVVVSGNVFANLPANSQAILIGETGKNTITPTDLIITSNSFSTGSLKALVNSTPALVDASGNWWGTTSSATIATLVSGQVDTSPFLTSGSDADAVAPGFQGDTSVVQVPAGGSITEAAELADGGSIIIEAGAYNEDVDFGDITINATLLGAVTFGSLAGGSGVAIDNGGFGMTVGGGNASTEFAGVVNGTGGLTKVGTGTLILSGANAYTGATTVNGGTLLVNGSLANGPAANDVVVNAGGTLGGSGTIAGTVQVNGGAVAPGTSPGILNTGSIAFNSASTLEIEMAAVAPAGSVAAGADYDQLNVTGTVDLGGATLDLTGVSDAASGNVLTIIANDGVDPVVGTFAGLSNASTVLLGSVPFAIFYNAGDGNDVILVAVPMAAPPSVVYVDDSWVGTPLGADPDGAGPAVAFGYDAFATIQAGVNAVADDGADGADVIVLAGNYNQAVTIPAGKSLDLSGAGASQVTWNGGFTSTPLAISGGSVVTVDGFTIAGGIIGVDLDGVGTVATISNSVVTAGSAIGILIDGDAALNVSGSTLAGGGAGTGVAVVDGSATIATSIIKDRTDGVVVTADGSATLFGNDLSDTFGNYVIQADSGAGVINASGNWWGTTDESQVAAKVLGDVDFSPYLAGGAATPTGFAGDFSHLHVTAVGSQSGSDGRILEAIDLISNGSLSGAARLIDVNSGSYVENQQVLIDKSLTITGDAGGKPVITPGQNFNGASASGAWWLVDEGVTFNLNSVELNGDGSFVRQALRSHGTTSVDSVDFRDIKGSAAYSGFAIQSFGGTVPGGAGSDSHGGSGASASQLSVTNSTFADIGRVGVLVKGTGATATLSGNTYTGKGAGNGLDYGVEVGAGANVALTGGNTITDNLGTATDGSTSAGILVTSFYGDGSQAQITGANVLSGNTVGLNIGFAAPDNSVVTVDGGQFTGNVTSGIRVSGGDAVLNIDNATITGNGTGVSAVTGAELSIETSDVSGNTTGIFIGSGANATIADNASIEDNDVGIDVVGGSATISDNDISDNTVAGVRINDAVVTLNGNDVFENGVGVQVEGTSTLVMNDGSVDDNATNGLLVLGDGTLQSITVEGTTFSGNAANGPIGIGQGDITLFEFAGPAGTPSVANFTDVTINSANADYAIQVRGRNGDLSTGLNLNSGSTADVNFTNVDIQGTQARFGMLIQQYANLGLFTFEDVTFDSAALGGVVIFDADGMLDLGNTTFSDSYTAGDGIGDGTGFDIATSLNDVDATDVTFVGADKSTLAGNFAIEDRVAHSVDASAPLPFQAGYVNWIASGDAYDNAVFLTTESWVPTLNSGASVQRAIDVADAEAGKDHLYIQDGAYTDTAQVVIDTDITIEGEGETTTILTKSFNTTNAGDGRGWWLVNDGVQLNLSDVGFDGGSTLTAQAIRHKGEGVIDNVAFDDIKFNASGPDYAGTAIAYFPSSGGNLDVTNSEFTQIGRVGVLYFGNGVGGPAVTGTFEGNTYTGKGAGNWLDYGLEVSAGADVDVIDNTITGNRGVALSDGSTSAGVLITTFFAGGTTVDFSGDNDISENSSGVIIGFNAADTSTVTIDGGRFADNDGIGVGVTSGRLLIQNADLTGNDVGLYIEDGAIVDAGSLPSDGNPTGLGNSAGNNVLTGYTGAGGNYAIENRNLDSDGNVNVYARNNQFGSVVPGVIEQVVYHTVDDATRTEVFFTPAAPPNNTPLPPTVVFVNDDWDSTATGADADGAGGTLGDGEAFGYDQFATIQDAIDAVAAGGTIYVYAGTYAQSIVIDKSLDLLSELSGVDARGRVAANEAIITSAVATETTALVTIAAADVTIDGFTIDGNAGIAGGVTLRDGSTVSNAARGIAIDGDNAQVLNNRVQNLYRRGIQTWVVGAAPPEGGVVQQNEIDGIGVASPDGFFSGDGILAFSPLADISDNNISNATTGMTLIAVYPGAPTATTVTGNNIAAANGIALNQISSIATVSISGNTVVTEDGGVGLLLWSVDGTATSIGVNSFTGTGVGDRGVYAWDGTASGVMDVTITGASFTGYQTGVQLTNEESTYGSAPSNAVLTLSGVSISTAAGGVGVLVEDGGVSSSTVHVNVADDSDITTGGGTAVAVSGSNASADVTGNDASIHGNAVGVDVDGGTATVSGNHIYDNGVGVQFRNGGTGSVTNNNFDDGSTDPSADNETDVLIESSAGTVTIGDGNDFAGDDYFIDNRSSQGFNLVPLTATTYEGLTPGVLADDFRIEDQMFHGPDSAASGVVRWVTGSLFVTANGTGESNETIQNAIDVADANDTINVEAGVYNEDVSIHKVGLKVVGAGDGVGGTTIDYTGLTGVSNGGVHISANDVELRGVNVTQTPGDSVPRYGVKVDFVDGVVIDGVTITNSFRSGLDLHGVTNVTVNDLTSQNNGGAGIFMTDVKGADLSNITTANNPWTGVSIATSGQYTTLGTNGIVFSGTNSFSESGGANGGLQLEMFNYATNSPYAISWSSNPADNADITIQSADFGFALSGHSFDGGDNTHEYVRFYNTLGQAESAAAGSPDHIDAHSRYIQEADDSDGLPNSDETQFYVFDNAGNTMSIQAAIDAAVNGDDINVGAGTFSENVVVNKHVAVLGAGNGDNAAVDTIVEKAGPGAIFTLVASASGASAGDPLLFSNLRVNAVGVYGFHVPNGNSLSNVELNAVKVIGSTPTDQTETEVGLWINTTASVDNLAVINSEFSELSYGWYFQKHGDFAPGSSNVTDVTVTGTTFDHNQAKGLYIEKLSDATFTNVFITNNGWDTNFFNAAFNTGADINLKGQIAYENLIFNNLTVTGNATAAANGAGLAIKARGSSPADSSYSSTPASLDNVQINGGTFSNNGVGIRIGEPGKANQEPVGVVIGGGVTIDGNTIAGIDVAGGEVIIDGAAIGASSANAIGVNVNAGVLKVQNTDLGANTIGVRVQNNSVVDLGQAGAPASSDYTGLGVSAGNNDFTGYATSSSTSGAIVVTGTDAGAAGPQGYPADIAAFGNTFAGTNSVADAEAAIYHDGDDTNVRFVDFAADIVVTSATLTDSVNEGGTATFQIDFTNESQAHTLTIDWGDGSAPQVINIPAGTFTYTATHPYADDNPSVTSSDSYAFSYTLTDSGSGSESGTDSITVNNVAPVLVVNAVAAISENGVATLSGTIADVPADSFSLVVDWGDGSALETFNYPAGTTSFSETHTYADDNPTGTSSDVYTISVTLADDDSGSDFDSVSVTVTNEAPIVDAGPAQVVDEGTLVTLSGSFTDAGPNDTHTFNWTVLDSNNAVVATSTNQSFSFTPTDNDVYTATFTVTDDDGGVTSDTTTITVDNVAPTLVLNAVAAVNENGVATLSGSISDPSSADTFTLVVDWGDGSPLQTFNYPAGTTSFSETHTYADDNPSGTSSDIYTISVTLSDDNLGADSDSTTVTVNNVAPIASAGPDQTVNEASLVSLSGLFSDVGLADSHTFSWTVAASNGQVIAPGNAQNFSFTPTDEGTYTVTFTVTDDDGGSHSDVVVVTVNDVAPTVDIDVLTTPIAENTATTLTFKLVDPGSGDLASTQQVSINWGDGSPTTVINSMTDPARLALLQAGSAVTLTHTYVDDATPGTSWDAYTISFTSIQTSPTQTFAGMGPATGSLPATVTVNNVAPTGIFTTTTPTVPAGSSVSVNWVAQTDQSPADVAGLRYTYFIDANNNGAFDSGEQIAPTTTYGDGTYAGSTASPGVSIPGSYFMTPGTVRIGSEIRDNDGGVTTQVVDVIVTPTTFQVLSVTPTASGFIVEFNRAADDSVVNLYAGRLNDTPTSVSTDDADVQLVGDSGVGIVRGSLVWNAARTGFEFVATGGVLAPATYSLLIQSGDTAFQDDVAGEDLDGDSNTTPGGDFTDSFTINPSSAIVVSLPDFARGATNSSGQSVSLPFGNSDPGIPVTISDGDGVTSIDFDVVFDPTLLTITDVQPADGVTAAITYNFVAANRLRVTVASIAGLAGDDQEFVRLIASVPANAAYGGLQVMRIENLEVFDNVTELASIGDMAIHKAVFIGDATANGTYTGQDAGWIAEVRVGTYTGFGEYPLTDPVIVADVNQNGALDAQDSTWVSQKGINAAIRPEIPNIPTGVVLNEAGVDPTIAVPNYTIVAPGAVNQVPVNITDSAVGLTGFNVRIAYDTTAADLPNGLDAGGISVAGMFAVEGGWSLTTFVDESAGTIDLSFFRSGASTSTAGQIASIAFDVMSAVAAGDVSALPVSGPANDPPFSYTYVSGNLIGTYTADFDVDGEVDGEDLDAWEDGYGAQPSAVVAQGDEDRDGVVDGADFLAWQRQVGSAITIPAAVSAGVAAVMPTVASTTSQAGAPATAGVTTAPSAPWWLEVAAADAKSAASNPSSEVDAALEQLMDRSVRLAAAPTVNGATSGSVALASDELQLDESEIDTTLEEESDAALMAWLED